MSLRVLVISHPSVAAAYRRKFELVAQPGDVELRLIVPPAWPEESRDVRFDASDAPDWAAALPIAFEGYYARYFYTRGLARQFRDFRPEVVHVEEEPFSVCAAQSLWMTARHAPSAKYIFRTSVSHDVSLKALARPFLGMVEQGVFRRADCAFALTEAAGELMRARGFGGEVRVFPNGVDVRVFRPREASERSETRARLGVGPSFTVAYVGRVLRLKGIDTLLRAAAALPDVHVAIVGDGEDRGRLEGLAAELESGPRVTFTGALPPGQVADVVGAVDALVLPTRTAPGWSEFFGRTLIEAMACGVPVVGSDTGEIPRTVGDAGLVFPEGNVEALTSALAQLAGDAGLRAELVRRGLERVRLEFAWEAIAEKTRQAYHEIAVRSTGLGGGHGPLRAR